MHEASAPPPRGRAYLRSVQRVKWLAPRRNLRAFAELVGRPLTDWQARALDLATPITVVVAGRGMGKSRSLALLATWSAFRHRGFRALVVSASESSARRLLSVRGCSGTTRRTSRCGSTRT